MKNKGFTLVEMIAVLVVMGILLTLTLPAVFNTLDKRKKSEHDATINEIISAAKLYVVQNNDVKNYLETTGEVNISYNKLVEDGLIKNKQIDPLTNEQWNTLSYVNIKYNSTNLSMETEYKEGQIPSSIYLNAQNISTTTTENYFNEKLLESVDARDETGRNYITAVTYSCQINKTGEYTSTNCELIKNRVGKHFMKYKLLNQEKTIEIEIN